MQIHFALLVWNALGSCSDKSGVGLEGGRCGNRSLWRALVRNPHWMPRQMVGLVMCLMLFNLAEEQSGEFISDADEVIGDEAALTFQS